MRRRTVHFPALFLGLAALATIVAPVAAQGPQIEWGSESLQATGFTPGGQIVWFGVERRIDPDLSADIVSYFRATTAAGDGSSLLALDTKLSERAIWVAVDLATGGYSAATPTDYALDKLEVPPVTVQSRSAAVSDALVDSRPYLLGLLVRPQLGAWSFGGGDGGPSDDDGANDGQVSFAMDGLSPIDASPSPPSRAGGDDLCFVIDPLAMDLSILKGGVAQ
jgi:hypothetical protein